MCSTDSAHLSEYSDEQLAEMLDAVRKPIVTLTELPEAINYFFGDDIQRDESIVETVFQDETAAQVLDAFEAQVLAVADFMNPEALAEAMKAFTTAMKPLKAKAVMWPIRAAISGRTHGADLSVTLYLLGKDRVATRVASAKRLAQRVAG